MSSRYNRGSHYENHHLAAELHDLPAHSHRAAEQQEKQEHLTGHQHFRPALEHSHEAYQRTQAAVAGYRMAALGHTDIADFDSLFTKDKPVVFNFHGDPWLIQQFTYRPTNTANIHVHGYKEKGDINTPLELAIRNQVDRLTLAIVVIDRVPKLQASGAHPKEWLKKQIVESIDYAYTNGIDKPEIRNSTWPVAR